MAVLAADASAFYAGVPFAATSGRYVTTPQVYGEISHVKGAHDALGALIETGRLEIVEPDSQSLDAARRAAEKTGDLPALSEPDVSIIALCIQAGLGAVTDDYPISNVLCDVGLDVTPVMTRGIRHVRTCRYYCPGCRTPHTGSLAGKMRCPVCDSVLRRVPTKTRRV